MHLKEHIIYFLNQWIHYLWGKHTINIKRILFLSIILGSLLTIASCGGDADCDDVGVFDEFNSLTSQASVMASTLDITDQDQCW